MRIAVIFSRLGPYHIARLDAAARAASETGGEVACIEVARADGVYEWDGVAGSGAFVLKTLFADRNYAALSAREIRAATFRALDELEPDAVAINGWSVAEARAAITWAERRGRVAVVMSETKADDARRVWWKEAAKRWLIGRCDAALVGGAAHAHYLEHMRFPPERIVLGYDVIDNDYFRSRSALVREDAAARRAGLGLPGNYFFACTRFIARKNVDLLLRAYAGYRAQTSGAAWGLVVAGNGEEAGRLRALERELKLDGVIWPGFVQYDELPLYYGLASAFVHPACAEPWGLVVNEAIASSLPVLVSQSVGAASELVKDGVNGYVFDPSDADDLARAMTQLAGMSAEKRAQMGHASREISRLWGPDRFGAGLLAAVGMGKRTRARRIPAIGAPAAMAETSSGAS